MRRYRHWTVIGFLAALLPLAAARADGAKLCMFDDHSFADDPEHRAIAQLPYLTHVVVQINWSEVQEHQTVEPNYAAIRNTTMAFWLEQNELREFNELPALHFIYRIVPYSAPGDPAGAPPWVYDAGDPGHDPNMPVAPVLYQDPSDTGDFVVQARSDVFRDQKLSVNRAFLV